MKKVILVLMFAFTASMLVSCGEDENPTKKQLDDIITLAQENGFTSLAAALTKADLVDALQGEGPFTVFAPTNEAFDALLTTIGQESIDDVPTEILTDILLYHVVSGAVLSEDVTAGNVPTLLPDNSITLATTGGITVNGVDVISPFDVEASNGVIHTIDGVLVPAGIAAFVNTNLEPAYFNANFTTLVAAVVKAGLVGTLQDAEALTIFAPTNDAFVAAGINVASTDVPTLTSVLTYHVLGSKVLSSQLPRSAEALSEDMLYFTVNNDGAFVNGNVGIINVDIESDAAVVHVIDEVLFAPTENIVEVASGNSDFSSLVAALTRVTQETQGEVDLVGALSGEGPFTVFAPTNAAFSTLLMENDWATLQDVPLGLLIEVLQYHVVTARAYDVDLPNVLVDGQVGTLQGDNLSINLGNGTINSTSNISNTNINATNGVIHVIDRVLIPNL
jgi:transforming growth factor-beta-induced protein